MEVEILFVKIDDTKKTVIPIETMEEKELDEKGLNLKKKAFSTVGGVPKNSIT